ncbi:hypothetical protein BT67DRAFT_267129 [Trichocladium antarcticum]|uniref:Uncharacterized protein n=1 Tax=Trichocladium antarcticum TaxID=1450529 RepID=A0AAN6UBU3_9PEZI|nr:hypothetical protein BT67DRAFT_267129 [Trichocladium antarcticum]
MMDFPNTRLKPIMVSWVFCRNAQSRWTFGRCRPVFAIPWQSSVMALLCARQSSNCLPCASVYYSTWTIARTGRSSKSKKNTRCISLTGTRCIMNYLTGALYDEASTLGLLDLFTSLVLRDPSDGMKSRNLLLLREARALAESAQAHDEGLMRSRPFIQWLLAKAALEMQNPNPLDRRDGARLGDFGGLMIDQGKGIHLPLFVPGRNITNKPDWAMFSSRSSDATRRVTEVAAGAAHDIGDHTLQAEALKLLALQSLDPRRWMDTLAHLQLETQGDREGYLTTCLAKYLVSAGNSEEAILLRDLTKLDSTGGGGTSHTLKDARTYPFNGLDM